MTRAKYIAELDKDKEAELIRKYQETGDNESLKHILQSLEKCIYKASKNFVFVGPGGKKRIRNYFSSYFSYEDLRQEAIIASMKCIKEFDTNMGTRLSTYAYLPIKNAIHEYVKRNDRSVRSPLSKTKQKAIKAIRKKKKERTGSLTKLEKEELSRSLSTSERTIEQIEIYHTERRDISLDREDEDDKNNLHNKFQDPYSDPLCLIEEENDQSFLNTQISKLDDQTREVIKLRINEGKKYREIARDQKISVTKAKRMFDKGEETILSSLPKDLSNM